MTFSSFDTNPGLTIWQPIGAARTQHLGRVWAPERIKHVARYCIYIPVNRAPLNFLACDQAYAFEVDVDFDEDAQAGVLLFYNDKRHIVRIHTSTDQGPVGKSTESKWRSVVTTTTWPMASCVCTPRCMPRAKARCPEYHQRLFYNHKRR